MTATTETRAEFHARRAKGIGGSDVGAILGVDRYKDAEELWLLKTGQKEPDDTETPDQRRGRRFEKTALEEYQAAYPRNSVVIPAITHGAHKDYPWMLYNVDAYLIIDGEECVGEVKCPSLGMFSRIKREGLPESWIVQMQHYLCCTGLEKGIWIIFCADRMELLTFEFTADKLFHELLIEKEREFWTLVETMTPPEPIIAEMKDGKIEVVGKVEKRYDEEARDAISLIVQAKALKKTAEEQEAQAIENFVEVVGDRFGVFEAPGIGRINRATRAGRTSFDAKALANARPLDRIKTMTAIMESFEGVDNPHWLAKRVQDCIEGCDLDLSQFQKVGASYTEVRAYSSKED